MQQLRVLRDIGVALDPWLTDNFNHLDTVIAAVYAAHAVQNAGEQAVLDAFQAVVHCFACVADFAVDANGGAEGPPSLQ